MPQFWVFPFEVYTAQKMKFSIKDFLSKCDQIHSFLGIWLHLLKKSAVEKFIFCAVICQSLTRHDFLILYILIKASAQEPLFGHVFNWSLLFFNPFFPNAPFLYPPENIGWPHNFLMFSGVRKRVHWERMGQLC